MQDSGGRTASGLFFLQKFLTFLEVSKLNHTHSHPSFQWLGLASLQLINHLFFHFAAEKVWNFPISQGVPRAKKIRQVASAEVASLQRPDDPKEDPRRPRWIHWHRRAARCTARRTFHSTALDAQVKSQPFAKAQVGKWPCKLIGFEAWKSPLLCVVCGRLKGLTFANKVQDEVENSIEDTEATSGTQGFVNRMADVDRGGVIRSKTCPNDGAQAIHQHGLSHWVVITLAMRQGMSWDVWVSSGSSILGHIHTSIYRHLKSNWASWSETNMHRYAQICTGHSRHFVVANYQCLFPPAADALSTQLMVATKPTIPTSKTLGM